MKSSDKAVKDYFSALLDEPKPTPIAVFSPLQKLLDGVKSDDSLLREDVKPERIKTSQVETFSPTFAEPLKFPTIQEISEQVIQDPPKVSDSLLATSAVGSPTIDEPLSEPDRSVSEQVSATMDTAPSALLEQPPVEDAPFQVLYFDVAGVVLAVPLEDLGGIYRIEEDSIRQLIGKPNWFMGLMLHRERQFNVVNSALWIMPEKYNEELAEKLNYQYLVMLKDSNWGFACEKLITTSLLAPADVNWRQTMGKRPWLRGMVKQKMCALLNVDALTELLNTGRNG